MTLLTFRGRLGVAAYVALLVVTTLNAQPAATGPWAKMPALPTVCYQAKDPFPAKLEAAHESVQADVYKQQAVNNRIRDDSQNIDPMEKQARVQELLMSDPEAARKWIQSTQTAGAQIQTNAAEDAAREQQLQAEEKDLMNRYEAARQKAYAPANARWKALTRKLGIPEDSRGPGELGVPDWAYAEFDAVKRDRDSAYQATCPQWWGAAGPMQAYMKHYKDWLVQKHIPNQQEVDEQTAASYAIFGTPTATYKSTATMEGMLKYMGVAKRVYSQRLGEPNCTAEGCNQYNWW